MPFLKKKKVKRNLVPRQLPRNQETIRNPSRKLIGPRFGTEWKYQIAFPKCDTYNSGTADNHDSDKSVVFS